MATGDFRNYLRRGECARGEPGWRLDPRESHRLGFVATGLEPALVRNPDALAARSRRHGIRCRIRRRPTDCPTGRGRRRTARSRAGVRSRRGFRAGRRRRRSRADRISGSCWVARGSTGDRGWSSRRAAERIVVACRRRRRLRPWLHRSVRPWVGIAGGRSPSSRRERLGCVAERTDLAVVCGGSGSRIGVMGRSASQRA